MRAQQNRSRWGAVRSRSQTSFVFGVALVPAFVAEVARGIDSEVPWYVVSMIILASILAFLIFALLAAERQASPLPTAGATDGIDLRQIERVVSTVDARRLGDGTQAIHTLVRQLPQLTSLHLVMGDVPPVPAEQWSAGLRAWLDQGGFSRVTIDAYSMLSPRNVVPTQVEELARRLGHVDPAGTIVDITGGTAAMSIALFTAAQKAGHRITYAATYDDPPNPRRFEGLVEISALAAQKER